jgi:murein DD-endopeptidase MepM/ murein hydrolase activator NlpD
MEVLGATSNSDSFRKINLTTQVEIPISGHVGSFGFVRKHHVHEGVDLYCPERTEVFAVEAGTIVVIEPFTGKQAGSSWWNDTWVVLVEGESGVVAYGEIAPNSKFSVGEQISKGESLGFVLQVLKKDKGRPLTMLHLELHLPGTRTTVAWEVGNQENCPSTLLDPTKFLLESSR